MVFTCIRNCSEQKSFSIYLHKYSPFPLESIDFENPTKDKQICCLILIHKFSTFPPQHQCLLLSYVKNLFYGRSLQLHYLLI